MPPFEPPAVGSSAEAQKLIAYYRENGDSDFLLRLECALDGTPRTATDLAHRSETSAKWARNALQYLAVEGRAKRDWERTTKHAFKKRTWRYLWCLPDKP